MKEDLIALYFLAGETVEEADLMERKRKIEATIVERYGVAVDFEIEDALQPAPAGRCGDEDRHVAHLRHLCGGRGAL